MKIRVKLNVCYTFIWYNNVNFLLKSQNVVSHLLF